MKFKELDRRMREFETSHDRYIPDDVYIVARIDGRGFSKLTQNITDLQKPYDSRFNDFMVETVQHLMQCGFYISYGYCQSDEISLLFSPENSCFQKKERKFNSVLAGEASAKFTLLLGDLASFDCRISELPTIQSVIDYFMWRKTDSYRNCFNCHSYWYLRGKGHSARKATSMLDGMSAIAQQNFLRENGIDINTIPSWQKYGVGMYWEKYQKKAFNPKTNEEVFATRKRLKIDSDLSNSDAYKQLITGFVKPALETAEAVK